MVVDVSLLPVFAQCVLMRRVRVVQGRVVVLMPMGRQEVVDAGADVRVMRHVIVQVIVDHRRV
jgi:hypothetical protein